MVVREPTVTVRHMRRGDADTICKMMASLAAHHGDLSKTRAADFVIYGVGAGRMATIWFALMGRNPAGFAITYDWIDFVRGHRVRNIDALFVEEHYRKRGVGSALIGKIVTDAKMLACQRVTVGAAKDNLAANSFYQNLGFTPRNQESFMRYQVTGAEFHRLALSGNIPA